MDRYTDGHTAKPTKKSGFSFRMRENPLISILPKKPHLTPVHHHPRN